MKTIEREPRLKTSSESSSETSNSSDHVVIPGMLGFMSSHVLINKERVRRGRESLRRNRYLDRVCQLQAETMAEQGELSHTSDSNSELQELVNSKSAGENIQRGPNIQAMHEEAMNGGRSAYKNIISRKFTEFGMGTARGSDGKLYMVQLFRGDVIVPETKN